MVLQARCSEDTSGRRRAFTLVELLVVISVVALLLALLVPALSRARKQAQAVACQANLKQWGLHFATLASENEGRVLEWETWDGSESFFTERYSRQSGSWLYWGYRRASDPLAYTVTGKMRLCPTAGKLSSEVFDVEDYDTMNASRYMGGTFLAWGQYGENFYDSSQSDYQNYSSYGLNRWHRTFESDDMPDECWRTIYVRSADRVPYMLDSAGWLAGGLLRSSESVPEQEAVPLFMSNSVWPPCINRHSGAVNCLFTDWSVRKVGLKELWTLQWYPQYDTAGPWTKAGGVQPSDWPEWLRGFKDY